MVKTGTYLTDGSITCSEETMEVIIISNNRFL